MLLNCRKRKFNQGRPGAISFERCTSMRIAWGVPSDGRSHSEDDENEGQNQRLLESFCRLTVPFLTTPPTSASPLPQKAAPAAGRWPQVVQHAWRGSRLPSAENSLSPSCFPDLIHQSRP